MAVLLLLHCSYKTVACKLHKFGISSSGQLWPSGIQWPPDSHNLLFSVPFNHKPSTRKASLTAKTELIQSVNTDENHSSFETLSVLCITEITRLLLQ